MRNRLEPHESRPEHHGQRHEGQGPGTPLTETKLTGAQEINTPQQAQHHHVEKQDFLRACRRYQQRHHARVTAPPPNPRSPSLSECQGERPRGRAEVDGVFVKSPTQIGPQTVKAHGEQERRSRQSPSRSIGRLDLLRQPNPRRHAPKDQEHMNHRQNPRRAAPQPEEGREQRQRRRKVIQQEVPCTTDRAEKVTVIHDVPKHLMEDADIVQRHSHRQGLQDP